MTVSVNTAMSMASVLSDKTIQGPAIPEAMGGSRRWADVVSDVSLTSRTTVGNSPSWSNPPNAELVSALSSIESASDMVRGVGKKKLLIGLACERPWLNGSRINTRKPKSVIEKYFVPPSFTNLSNR